MKYLFHIFQYVPDTIRNEFVNIGIMIRAAEPETGRVSFEMRFTRDWRRVRGLDPGADTFRLEAIEKELRDRLDTDLGGILLRNLEESLSLDIQITAPKAFLVESVEAGIAELMQTFVEAPEYEDLRGRESILSKMQEEFQRTDVWDIVRKRITASEYTQPGDSLQIDIGYSHLGTLHWFHAVSLAEDAEMAKALSFSFPQLRAGVERGQNGLILTAVVESPLAFADSDDGAKGQELFRFGVETMRDHGISVVTTDDLRIIAETAREHLNA